jgi:signal transduction histidine kinase
MRWRGYLPNQVLIIALLTAGLAVAIALYFPSQVRSTAERGLHARAVSLATVLGTLVAPSVEFEQVKDAQTQIASLAGDPDLRYALLLKPDGSLFARYRSKDLSGHPELLTPVKEVHSVVRTDLLHVSVPLRNESTTVGTLTMGFSRQSVVASQRTSRLWASLVGLLLFLMALAASWVTIVRKMADEQKAKLQGQLVQSEKLAAVGQLASGIAHEINNPLGVILGFAQGIERRMQEGDSLRLPVTSIVREALRCKALVQELLAFSRTAKTSVEPVDCNTLVSSTALLLEARAKTQNIRVVKELAEHLPIAMANKTQMQQVLVNLGNNALDAMSAGGVLTLRTRRDSDGASLFEVTDTGTGIPAEIRSRIFEPFFTTKEVGKGTGLGLSIVHEIVHQHGGTVDAHSEVGKGTTMVVRLPCAPTGSKDVMEGSAEHGSGSGKPV